jgi:hypothetical protein
VSETSAGSIVGFLRLDIADFEAGIDRAMTRADELERKSPNVRVTADTAGADTKLAATAAAEDRVAASNKKVGSSGEEASLGMGSLIAAAVAVGPAIVPIALGATGLAVGFGAMGVAGIAAMVGIKQELRHEVARSE